MYDIIGDTHGYADELVQLLETLGYRETSDGFRHADRTAVFCGDFVDRGPQIPAVISIVRRMVESGAALAVMGNHEFNAIAFQTPRSDEPGQFYRRHTERNIRQHQETLAQLSDEELSEALAWFATLPMSLDLEFVRIVHACWNPEALSLLEQRQSELPLDSEEFIRAATTPGDPLFDAVECVLKGPELRLPNGLSVVDKDGSRRTRTRIRWFETPGKKSWSEYCLPEIEMPELKALPVPVDCAAVPYAADDPPVFFGHYWLRGKAPAPLATNVGCVDYSVARGGMLCGYRFDGESALQVENFVSVPCRNPTIA